MNNLKGRIKQLEKKAPKSQVVYDVQLVDEITPKMRQAEKEALARGGQYFIIEPEGEIDHA